MSSKQLLFVGGLFLLLLVYLVLRTINVPLADDEAITVLEYARMDLVDIFTNNNSFLTANNHLLHTLLVKFITSFASHSEFLIRLPNLFGFTLFFWSIVALLYGKRYWQLALIIIVLNPYLLEFFSLARGYGLGIGLMFASCVWLMKSAKVYKARTLYLSFLLALLAALANFTLLYSFLAISVLLILLNFYFNRKNLLPALNIAVSSLVSALYTVWMLQQINRYGDLIHGGRTNFVVDTLSSIVITYVQSNFPLLTAIGATSLLIMIVAIIASLALGLWDRDTKWVVNNGLVPIVLLINVVAINAHFYIFGIPLYLDRTASFLLPLIIVSFVMCFEHSLRSVGRIIMIALIILQLVNFANLASVSRSYVFAYNEYNRQIIDELRNVQGIVAVDYRLIYSLIFYSEKYDLYNLDLVQLNSLPAEELASVPIIITTPESSSETPTLETVLPQLKVVKMYKDGIILYSNID